MSQKPLTRSSALSRRTAMRSLGAASLAAAGVAVTQASARGVPVPERLTTANVHAVTVEDLRAAATADPAHLYHVTDDGQEGMFYHDPDDTTSTDNTGLVLVSSAGLRFHRIFQGEIRLSWFGVRADYDPAARTGTPNDDAFALALDALKPFGLPTDPRYGGWRESMPTLRFDAGNYLFTRKQHRIDWYTALRGLRIAGEGMYATTVYFDCPEDANGEDNYLFVNANQMNSWQLDDLSFFGVSGSERFVRITSTGTASVGYFSRCTWTNFKLAWHIAPSTANADLLRFEHCHGRLQAGSVFWLSENPQSVINQFFECHLVTDGTIFRFTAGGILNVFGGSWIMPEQGTMLEIEDPDGTGIGSSNGTFLFVGAKPEVRRKAQLLRMRAPEAHVHFLDCHLTMSNASSVQGYTTWKPGVAYKAGAGVRDGAELPVLSRAFVALRDHTAQADTRPVTGARWREFWQPHYEIEVDEGFVEIQGGTYGYVARLGNHPDAWKGERRTGLTVRDAFLLMHLGHSVDFAEGALEHASAPRAVATGCQPYTGVYPTAYWAKPDEPVNVALNAHLGFSGAAPARQTHVFRAFPERGQGLPASGDGPVTFRLPPGANVLRMTVHVPGDQSRAASVSVKNHDGSVTFAPRPKGAPGDEWYPIGTEEARTFTVTSSLPTRVEGFVVAEYV